MRFVMFFNQMKQTKKKKTKKNSLYYFYYLKDDEISKFCVLLYFFISSLKKHIYYLKPALCFLNQHILVNWKFWLLTRIERQPFLWIKADFIYLWTALNKVYIYLIWFLCKLAIKYIGNLLNVFCVIRL